MAEVEFRHGKMNIPDHLAKLMWGLETHRMTFEEARDAVNAKLVNDRFREATDKLLQTHFRNLGR